MADAASLDELSRQLTVLIRLTAISVTDGKKQTDQILALSRAGLAPRDIADILGTSPNTVSVELSRLRKAGTLGARRGGT